MKFLAPKQAAFRLGVSVRTLEDWRAANPPKGPVFYKVEGRVHYREDDLDAFLASSRIDPQEQPRLPFSMMIELELKRRESLKTHRKFCGNYDLSQLPIFAMEAR